MDQQRDHVCANGGNILDNHWNITPQEFVIATPTSSSTDPTSTDIGAAAIDNIVDRTWISSTNSSYSLDEPPISRTPSPTPTPAPRSPPRTPPPTPPSSPRLGPWSRPQQCCDLQHPPLTGEARYPTLEQDTARFGIPDNCADYSITDPGEPRPFKCINGYWTIHPHLLARLNERGLPPSLRSYMPKANPDCHDNEAATPPPPLGKSHPCRADGPGGKRPPPPVPAGQYPLQSPRLAPPVRLFDTYAPPPRKASPPRKAPPSGPAPPRETLHDDRARIDYSDVNRIQRKSPPASIAERLAVAKSPSAQAQPVEYIGNWNSTIGMYQ